MFSPLGVAQRGVTAGHGRRAGARRGAAFPSLQRERRGVPCAAGAAMLNRGPRAEQLPAVPGAPCVNGLSVARTADSDATRVLA